MMFPKPYADFAQRLRVPAGFVLLIAFAWLSKPSISSMQTGLPVSICGLLLRAWAAGHLAKNEDLATSGPFAYVRNPLYLGTLITAAGLVVAAREFALTLLFAAVFVLVYLPAIELEEQHLRSIFPNYGYSLHNTRFPDSVSFDQPGNKTARILWGSYGVPQTLRVKVSIVAIPGTNNYRISPKVYTVSNAGEAGFESKRPLVSLWNSQFSSIFDQIAQQASGAGGY